MANISKKYKQYLISKGKTSDEAEAIVSDWTKVEIQNDGSGPYLKSWNVTGIDQPNDSELAAVDSDADKLEALDAVHAKRKAAYPNIGDQLDDLYKQGAFSDDMAAKIKKVKDDNPKS